MLCPPGQHKLQKKRSDVFLCFVLNSFHSTMTGTEEVQKKKERKNLNEWMSWWMNEWNTTVKSNRKGSNRKRLSVMLKDFKINERRALRVRTPKTNIQLSGPFYQFLVYTILLPSKTLRLHKSLFAKCWSGQAMHLMNDKDEYKRG
jgi:hypothetical protein